MFENVYNITRKTSTYQHQQTAKLLSIAHIRLTKKNIEKENGKNKVFF
jgi:hypothetical protein